MKSFFASRLLRFNVLISLATVSFAPLIFPAIASAQEACVMTSAGDVVCGKPVPKRVPNSNPKNGDLTMQTEVDRELTWDLKSCVRQNKKITCNFSLTTSKDIEYTIAGARMVDPQGVEYMATFLQIGDRKGNRNSGVSHNMAKGALYKTTIQFSDVPDSVSEIVLLDLKTYCCWVTGLKFRGISIN